MKKPGVLFLFICIVIYSNAQDFSLKVWPDGASNHNGMDLPEEKYDGVRVRNVSEAEMYVYLAGKEKNTGAAILICPGGGYSIEAMDHEGFEIAEWLRERGITSVVLKYRLPYGHHEIPSMDARRAIKAMRANAAKWGIDPNKVGIAGSSAGGHLASTLGTRFDFGNEMGNDPIEKFSSKPDFMLLLYPVISMKKGVGHMGSRNMLLGKDAPPQLVEKYSNELHVSENTPPTFFVLADDDKAVIPKNSILFYSELKKHGIDAEMHIFSKGGHGFGMNKNGLPVDQWPNLFYNWLKSQKIINK